MTKFIKLEHMLVKASGVCVSINQHYQKDEEPKVKISRNGRSIISWNKYHTLQKFCCLQTGTFWTVPRGLATVWLTLYPWITARLERELSNGMFSQGQ